MKTRKRVLVIGATGFTGQALCSCLWETKTEEGQLTKASIAAGNEPGVLECDCRKSSEVNHLIGDIKPHEIYHLIGSYSKGYDHEYKTSVLSAKNIFDAIIGTTHAACARSCRRLDVRGRRDKARRLAGERERGAIPSHHLRIDKGSHNWFFD